MVTQRRKFGFFGGVFTPSILTILGVIMYLRLPQVVGDAGLWAAIGIVVAAHLISVTTGLSVSSIATDKRVKAGGSYYIISRSLGLPIGGTLGIALFVGLSFGVSLYLIGFAESFLTYWDINVDPATGRPDIDTIRVAGSITLVAVTTVTFISTSLAIKTQYIIMAAIALSLVSIFIGNPDQAAPATAHLEPLAEGASLVVLFGIFFPAVTGFEAGVSMSGDLKDPKRDIPRGTLLAIAVGFAMYLILVAFLAFRIPADQLADNPRVLLDYSLFAPLVVAGIWGATISSALGSILGAPRILQACAMDRIGPRLFAKGHGVDNEPRNALLLAFAIAEGGILIGSLDAIAGIVSMFFMASYGVLNLSCAVESWASPDFRPDFRIPRLVSIVGALTCFILMMQLDMIAMFGAFAVMAALYLWLKRKELALEGGDTWTGIWSSIVRKGLDRLSRHQTHQRNWRPNVLLFTGARTALGPTRAVGHALVQHNGVLTEMALTGRPADRAAAPGSADHAADDRLREDEPEGFFRRHVQTDDPYAAIAAIARYHGMVGLEPNTAFIDWELLRDDPARARDLLDELYDIDRNVVLSVQRARVERHAGGRVDVWWHGDGRNLALALALVRFLTTAEEWVQSTPRFLVAVADPGQKRTLEHRLAAWLRDARVVAEVRVLDAPAPPERFEALVARASAQADLVVVGLEGPEQDADLPETIEALATMRRPLLLVRAASAFEDPFPHVDLDAELVLEEDEEEGAWRARPETLKLTEDPALAGLVMRYHADLASAIGDFHSDCQVTLASRLEAAVAEIERLMARALDQLERAAALTQLARRRRTIHRIERGMLRGIEGALEELRASLAETQREALRVALAALAKRLRHLEQGLDAEIVLSTRGGGAEAREEARAAAAGAGLLSRLFRDGGWARWPLRRHVQALHSRQTIDALRAALERSREAREGLLASLGALVGWGTTTIARDARALARGDEGADPIGAAQRDELAARVGAWRGLAEADLGKQRKALTTLARDVAQLVAGALADPLNTTRPSVPTRPADGAPFDVDAVADELATVAALQRHHVRRIELDVALRALHLDLDLMVHDAERDLHHRVERGVLAELDAFLAELKAFAARPPERAQEPLELHPPHDITFEERSLLARMSDAIERSTEALPESVVTLSEASFQALADGRFDELEEVTIALRRLVSFVVKNDLLGEVREALAKLSAAVARAANAVRDVARLVAFGGGLEASEAEREVLHEERQELVHGGVERIETERGHVDKAWRELQRRLPALRDQVVERTQMAESGRSAGRLDRFIRTHERVGLLDWVRQTGARLRDGVRQGMVDLSYRWSRGVLLARRLRHTAEEPASPVERLIRLHRRSSPSAAVWERLPIFYRQVFLGRAAADPSYQLPESEALSLAARAVDAHTDGHPGALWITGPPGSGVGALMRRIVHERFVEGHTFTVRPAEAGSVDPTAFDEALARALGAQGDPDEALSTLPEGSAVVVEDLELWWERSLKGLAVLERLEGLIERHGDRTLFVLGVNEYVMRLLRRLGVLVDQALATVHCRPLDARRLREAVMLRHSATGLSLRLCGDSREPNEWKTARLFSGLFDYSGGYIGGALAAWIAHIEEVTSEHVVIRRPRAPDLSVFDALDPDWVALLVELSMHKRIDRTRLLRVTRLEQARLDQALAGLQRAGLVVAEGAGLSLEHFTAQHVMRWLRDRGIL